MKLYRLISIFLATAAAACGPATDGVTRPLPQAVAVRILNAVSREPIADVTVTVADREEYTDAQGTWSTELVAGDYEVTLAAEDFESQTLTLTLPGEAPEEILLTPLAPELTGLSAQAAGGGERVTLTGRRFQNKAFDGSVVTIDDVPVERADAWSDTEITVTVPQSAAPGSRNVAVAVNGKPSAAKVLRVKPVLTLISATVISGGDTLVLTGSNFGAAQNEGQVTLNGQAVTVESWSNLAVSVLIPAEAAPGAGAVSLTAGGETSAALPLTILPVVDSVSAEIGSAPDVITLTGRNFGNAAGTLTFAGAAVTADTWSDLIVSFSLPADAEPGLRELIVANGGRAAAAVAVGVAPKTTNISAATAVAGESLSLTGVNFGAAPGTLLIGGGARATTAWSATALTFTVPADQGPGLVTAAVAAQGFTSVAQAFTIYPSVTSASVAAASSGDSVYLGGANFGAAPVVTVGGIAAAVTPISQTLLRLTIPAGLLPGAAAIVVTSASLAAADWPVTIRPRITSLDFASRTGGQVLHVLGGNFGTGGTVTIGGVAASATWSATDLTVTMPNTVTAGTRAVVVTAGGENSNAVNITVTPTLTSLASATRQFGDSLTIFGTNLGSSVGESTLIIGGATAAPTVWSQVAISAPIPAGYLAGAAQAVTVAVAGHASNALTLELLPVITALDAGAYVEGGLVSASGYGFGASPRTITFAGATVAADDWAANSFSFVVPATSEPGAKSLTVTAGGATSGAVNLFILPQILAATPDEGTAGDSITLTGSSFGATAGSLQVGGVPIPGGSVSAWYPTAVTFTLPAAVTAGVQNVFAIQSAMTSGAYEVTVNPVLTALSIPSGRAGTVITVSGGNFGTAQNGSALTFGGVPVTSVADWGATAIETVVPDDVEAGTRTVAVTVNGRVSNTLDFDVHPTITSLTANTGGSGTTFTINGWGFGDSSIGNRVEMNGVDLGITSWAAGAIGVSIPDAVTGGTRSVRVWVNGLDSNTQAFTVYPALTGSSTSSGTGTNQVTFYGANFAADAQVFFGTVAAPLISASSTQLVVEVPTAVTAGTRPVVVDAGGARSNSRNFSVQPNVTAVSNADLIFGEYRVLYGTNMGSSAGEVGNSLKWGSWALTPVTWSQTSITFTTPSNLPSNWGSGIYLKVNWIDAPGLSATVVPTLDSVSTTGVIGSSLVINGKNFSDNTAYILVGPNEFNFGGSTPTVMNTTVPNVTAGNVSLCVRYGSKCSRSLFFQVRPRIDSLTLTAASIGDAVTVNGLGFGYGQGSGRVTVGGVTAQVQSWTGPAITFLVPPGAGLGDQNVIVEVNGAASDALVLQVLPKLLTATPGSGPAGTVVTFGGAGLGNSGSLSIGNQAATVNAWTPSQIVAVVPGGLADGPVAVTATTSGGFNATTSFMISGIVAPTGLTATVAAPFKVDLAWTDNSNNEDGFLVERRVSKGTYAQMFTLPAGTTSYQDTAVTDAASYDYRVLAFQSATSSATTNEVTVKVPRFALKFAIGSSHGCYIGSNHALYCWGEGGLGQIGLGGYSYSKPTLVSALSSGVSDVAVGASHTCVVVNGGVKCAGMNNAGQLGRGNTDFYFTSFQDALNLTSGVKKVAAGTSHTCALLDTGAIKCFGESWSGQLGTGGYPYPSHTALDVALGGAVAVDLQAGGENTCAVLDTGALKCWGSNTSGQVGNNSGFNAFGPVDVSGMASGVSSVTVGLSHTCALKTDGTVKCWGSNASGELGKGDFSPSSVPVAVPGLTGIKELDAGSNYSCAVSHTADAVCWGKNDQYQLGGSVTGTTYSAPVLHPQRGLTSIQTGASTACSITAMGTLACWGAAEKGQTGDLDGFKAVQATKQPYSSGVADVKVGTYNGCSVKVDGSLWCWGDNWNAKLGWSDGQHRAVPSLTTFAADVVAVSTAASHMCLLKSSGALVCNGANYSGQLGNGSQTAGYNQEIFASGIAQVEASYDRTCAITTSQQVKCWGLNSYGTVGVGYEGGNVLAPSDVIDLPNSAVDVAITAWTTCALMASGDLYCWGLGYGSRAVQVASVPAGVADIEGGDYHFCLRTDQGAMYCWGNNQWGQQGADTYGSATPMPVEGMGSGVIDISAGGSASCAITTGGKVWCWGRNDQGQLGNGLPTGDVWRAAPVKGADAGFVAVDVGASSACALHVSGETYCWGSNDSYNWPIGLGVRSVPVTVSGF